MIYLVALLAIGGIIAIVAQHFSRGNNTNTDIEQQPSCDTCNGEDERCIKDCMLEAAIKDVEYFDDEELDTFIGRADDKYSDEEAEQFREIMITMQPREVSEWIASLTKRGINLPLQLRDEAILLIGG